MAPQEQGKNWCVTKNGLPVLEDLKASLNTSLSKGLVYGFFGTETAPTTGQKHLQGFLCFQTRKKMKTVKNWLTKFIPELVGAHLEKMKGSISQNEEYCSKEDEDPMRVGSKPAEKRPGNRSDLQSFAEAVLGGSGDLELAADFPNAHARYHVWADKIRRTKRQKTESAALMEKVKDIELRDWQRVAYQKLIGQDNRKVLWVWSVEGNVGKSTLGLWIVAQQKGFMCNSGKHSDIIFAFQKETYKFVVMDLSREQEERAPYAVMEGLKNGFLFSSKYDSGMCFFTPVKLIVFANFEPDRTKMSEDRWDVMQVVVPQQA